MSAYKAYGILWLSIHDVTSINSHNQSSKTTEYNQVYRNKMHYLNYPQTIRLCCSCKVRHISRKHSLMITCKCLWLCRNLQLCETGVDGKHNPRHSAQATNSRPVEIPAYFVVSPNWPVSRWYPINEGHLHLPKCDKNRRRYIIIHSKRPRSRTSLFSPLTHREMVLQREWATSTDADWSIRSRANGCAMWLAVKLVPMVSTASLVFRTLRHHVHASVKEVVY